MNEKIDLKISSGKYRPKTSRDKKGSAFGTHPLRSTTTVTNLRYTSLSIHLSIHN